MKRKTKTNLLAVGDVIKTHPREGFWGCAVVLNTQGKTEQFNPSCLIGLTPVVFQRDYEWREIVEIPLSILEFDRVYEFAPGERFTRHEICIGIYDARPHPDIPVIGCVDPSEIFSGSMDFEPIGDATNGRWPLCGRIPEDLGYEAVLVWNEQHQT